MRFCASISLFCDDCFFCIFIIVMCLVAMRKEFSEELKNVYGIICEKNLTGEYLYLIFKEEIQ